MRIDFRLIDRHLLAGVVAVWAAAVTLTVGAVTAVVGATRIQDVPPAAGKALAATRIEEISTPVDQQELASIAKRLEGAHPSVRVEVVNGRLRFSVPTAQAYSEWGAAVGDLFKTANSNMVFETAAICGLNCDNRYIYVEFVATRKRYEATS